MCRFRERRLLKRLASLLSIPLLLVTTASPVAAAAQADSARPSATSREVVLGPVLVLSSDRRVKEARGGLAPDGRLHVVSARRRAILEHHVVDTLRGGRPLHSGRLDAGRSSALVDVVVDPRQRVHVVTELADLVWEPPGWSERVPPWIGWSRGARRATANLHQVGSFAAADEWLACAFLASGRAAGGTTRRGWEPVTGLGVVGAVPKRVFPDKAIVAWRRPGGAWKGHVVLDRSSRSMAGQCAIATRADGTVHVIVARDRAEGAPVGHAVLEPPLMPKVHGGPRDVDLIPLPGLRGPKRVPRVVGRLLAVAADPDSSLVLVASVGAHGSSRGTVDWLTIRDGRAGPASPLPFRRVSDLALAAGGHGVIHAAFVEQKWVGIAGDLLYSRFREGAWSQPTLLGVARDLVAFEALPGGPVAVVWTREKQLLARVLHPAPASQ